jgi:hypothetical protein
MMARARKPLVVVISGAFGSASACQSDNQLPERTSIDFALFPQPHAGGPSGARRPWSGAATASARMGDARRAEGAACMICAGPVGGGRRSFPGRRDPGTSASGHFTGMPTRSRVPARAWRVIHSRL